MWIEVTADDSSSLWIVVSLVWATLAFPIMSEQLICPFSFIALRYEHAPYPLQFASEKL